MKHFSCFFIIIFFFFLVDTSTFTNKYNISGLDFKPDETLFTQDGNLVTIKQPFDFVVFNLSGFDPLWGKRYSPTGGVNEELYSIRRIIESKLEESYYLIGVAKVVPILEVRVYKINFTGGVLWEIELDHSSTFMFDQEYLELVCFLNLNEDKNNEYITIMDKFVGIDDPCYLSSPFTHFSKIDGDGNLIYSSIYAGIDECTDGIGCSNKGYVSLSDAILYDDSRFVMASRSAQADDIDLISQFGVISLIHTENGSVIWEGRIGLEHLVWNCQIDFLMNLEDIDNILIIMSCLNTTAIEEEEEFGSPTLLIKLNLQTKQITWKSMIRTKRIYESPRCIFSYGSQILTTRDILLFGICEEIEYGDTIIMSSYQVFSVFSEQTGELLFMYRFLEEFKFVVGVATSSLDNLDNFEEKFFYYIFVNSDDGGDDPEIMYFVYTDFLGLPCNKSNDIQVLDMLTHGFTKNYLTEEEFYKYEFMYSENIICHNQTVWNRSKKTEQQNYEIYELFDIYLFSHPSRIKIKHKCDTCFGSRNNYFGVKDCSGHGVCGSENTCFCDPNFFVDDCSRSICNGLLFNDSEVCRAHGECLDFNICNCSSNGYNLYTNNCDYKCFGILTSSNNNENNNENICSGHGVCVDIDNCTCISDNYQGLDCGVYTCYNISKNDVNKVCSGNGHCIDQDVCQCVNGYTDIIIDDDILIPCDDWKCYGIKKNDIFNVCSGMGICTDLDECQCSDDFIGDKCEKWKCGDMASTAEMTCNGNGKCIGPDDCECESGYIGDNWQINSYLYSIMTPILTVTSIIFSILIVCCILSICSCICFLILFFCCMSCVLCGMICLLKKRVKRFSKLKNFEILLQEQKLEEDTSIAHLRIDKKLFEIPYEELKMVKVLGEGGSASIVFLARWKGTNVAFKCFKTRQVCSDQDRYDEFERETHILGSVSHPNILQFLGCTLKPPRVGFLMDYCENGDLSVFLKKYKKKNSKSYSFSEKIRMIIEQCSAMDYLHSRNIIHRDLKLENVLVDDKERCKLMDFGLSKMISRMSQTKTKKIGTSMFMAPEILLSDKYDTLCDVFSFAVMMFIIFTENFSPYGEDSFGIEFKVASNPDHRPDLDELDLVLEMNENNWIKETIQRCWSHELSDRLSFKDLLDLFLKEKDINEVIDDSVSSSEIKLEVLIVKKKDEKEELKEYISVLERRMKELEKKVVEIEEVKNENIELKKEIKLLKDEGRRNDMNSSTSSEMSEEEER